MAATGWSFSVFQPHEAPSYPKACRARYPSQALNAFKLSPRSAFGRHGNSSINVPCDLIPNSAMIFPSRRLLTLISTTLHNISHATAYSVCSEPGLKTLRHCGASCIGCGPESDSLADYLLCGPPWPDECYCRTDLFNHATSLLHSCVSKRCTVGGWEKDYESAESFYVSYCRGAGFTAPVVTATVDGNAATVTRVTVVTETIASDSNRAGGVGTACKWLFWGYAVIDFFLVGWFEVVFISEV